MQPDKQEECQEEGKVTTLEQDNNEEDKAIETPVQQHDQQCVKTTITAPTIKTISKQNNEPSIINNDTITEATKQNLDTSQPTAVQQPTVDPGLIVDDKESTSFQNLVNAVQRILPRSKDPTHPDHAAIKILKNMTRGCTKQFPLKDRQKFKIAQADFLPFNFNENGFVREPVSDSNFQSVQHKPTLKRKKIKMQVCFTNRTALPQQLQGDTGANTSATDNLALLHDFQPFAVAEEVGVFLNNNDSTDAVTLEATGKGFIYILSDQGTTMHWETVYTPNGSGTVLSPDNYLNNNDENFYSFVSVSAPGLVIHNQSRVT